MVIRGQLDCHDPRLPNGGVFDIKTRATVAIRLDPMNAKVGLHLPILNRRLNMFRPILTILFAERLAFMRALSESIMT